MKRILFTLSLMLALTFFSHGQNTVVTDDGSYTSGDASAVLDVYSTGKGLLIPRVELTATSSNSPITSPATSLIVYNTATAGDVTPGYYYWNGAWVRISVAGANSDITSLTGLTTPLSVPQGGTGVGTLTGFVLGNGTSAMSGVTTSSGILSTISDETGTGALVFGTEPTFTTSITSPLIIGGTGTTSDLYFKTTSGVGASGADMHFLVGNNGATEAITILNSGNVGIGTNSPNTNQALHINHTTARANQQAFYSYATNGTSENRAIWGKSQALATAANNYGVVGEVDSASTRSSNSNIGVLGIGEGSSLNNFGVYGQSYGWGSANYGVYGESFAIGANNIGVSARSGYELTISNNLKSFYGVFAGAYGGSYSGSPSTTNSTNYGVFSYASPLNGSNTANYAYYAIASGGSTNYSFYGAAGELLNVAKIRSNTGYNFNGIDGATNTSAGIPTTLSIQGGIITSVTKTTPVANGTYNIDGSASGTVSSITITNGIITGITTR